MDGDTEQQKSNGRSKGAVRRAERGRSLLQAGKKAGFWGEGAPAWGARSAAPSASLGWRDADWTPQAGASGIGQEPPGQKVKGSPKCEATNAPSF